MSDGDGQPLDRECGASFSSRLLIDVVSAQLPPSPAKEQRTTDRTLIAADLDLEVTPRHSGACFDTLSPRPAPGLTLASIVRVERELARPVAIANGGTHVAFTRKDVERLRDPSVLRFMEEHSGLFAKYMHHSDGSTSVTPSPPQESTAARVEEEIESLRRAIDTFITAVDEDGRSYHILARDDGTVVVPVAVDEAMDGEVAPPPPWADAGERELDVLPPLSETGEDLVTSMKAAFEGEELRALLEESQTATHGLIPESALVLASQSPTWAAETSTSPHAAQLSTPSKLPPPATFPGGMRGRRALIPSSGVTATAGVRQRPARAQSKGRRAAKASASLAAPACPVRPVRALLPAEEARVEELLATDFSKTGTANFFVVSADAADRLRVIDEELSALRVVRRAQRVSTEVDEDEGENSASPAAASVARRTHESEADRRGDAYMREAADAVSHRQQLRAINAQLLRLHREGEALTAAVDASALPADVAALRPAWMSGPSPVLPDEETVARLLEEAEEEGRRCSVLGVASSDGGSPLSATADPYAPLRSIVSNAHRRALELLAKLEMDDSGVRNGAAVEAATANEKDTPQE